MSCCHHLSLCDTVMIHTCHCVTLSQPPVAVCHCCCLVHSHRAFSLLSGFIRRSSSTAIVDCLLCLLEKRFSRCQQEDRGDPSPTHIQERIATYHWLLTVFCDAISSLGLLAKISDFLSKERCCVVSKGIVNFIMQLVASGNPSSGDTVLVCCKVCKHVFLVFASYCHFPLPYCHCHLPLLSLSPPPTVTVPSR